MEAIKAREEREERTARRRIEAGVTAGTIRQPFASQIVDMMEVYARPMRFQLRQLNTEIERLRAECSSYYGSNLLIEYCTEYNTATEQAHRLRRAIELLEGDG